MGTTLSPTPPLFSIGFTDDVVNLNYTGSETVNMLIVNGTTMAPGIYGAGGTIPELAGTGTLFVLVPEPSTYILFGLGALAGLQRFRRKKS